MLSPIPPRLTVFVSGIGAALSKLQILTQPSSFACIFSALHLTLDFASSVFLKYFVKGCYSYTTQASCLFSALQTSVLSMSGFASYPWRDQCSPLGKEQNFPLVKSMPYTVELCSLSCPLYHQVALSYFHLFSSTRQHSHQAPLRASGYTDAFTHVTLFQ